MLTLTAVPAKAPRHIRGFDGPFLAGLQKNKQPLQLVRDAGNGILLRLLKLPADRLTDVITELENVQLLYNHLQSLYEGGFLLVERISKLRSHKQCLQKAVQIAGHSLVYQANITCNKR